MDDNLEDMSSLTSVSKSHPAQIQSGMSGIPLALQIQPPSNTNSQYQEGTFSRINWDQDTPITGPHTINPSAKGYYAYRLCKFDQKALNGKKLQKKELLNENNWLHWKSCIMHILWSSGQLHEFVLDQLPPPDKFLDPDGYNAWYELDQAVLEFIHGSIDSEQLTNIPGGLEVNGMTDNDQTTADFWDNICSV
jgi:hypothetical protein